MPYSPPRFFFFDKTNIHDSRDDFSLDFGGDVQMTCVTSGHAHVWLGDQNGLVHRLDRTQNIVSFRAHTNAIRHIHHSKHQDLLITVGIDENNDERLKVWNIAKWFNRPEPTCLRSTVCVQAGQTVSPVTCMCVDEKLQLIVLGFASGLLQAIRGDITRERSSKRFTLFTFSGPVTGLGTCPAPLDGSSRTVRTKSDGHALENTGPIVFAASANCTMSFMLSRRDEVQFQNILDQYGGGYNCSTMIRDSSCSVASQFAVADSQAVRFYNWDGRSRCLATGGDKQAVTAFKQYLVVVKGSRGSYLSPEPLINADQPGSPTESADGTDSTTVMIHDYQNHFIAGEFSVPGIACLLVEWDSIYLLCRDPANRGRYSLVCINEKSTQAKLELLFSKKNFQLALDIARSQKMAGEDLTQIIWRYADHLYKQKEYDASIKEYAKTIGVLETSFVIQRFLEGGHITQLAYYLESLSETPLATNDHLILLLNCYLRLQNKDKIRRFVEGPLNPNLNVAAAIHVLRQANFAEAALQLAQTAGHFSDRATILVEDLDDGLRALQCIETFPFDEALQAICTHGAQLMDRFPTETVHLLEKLCAHPDAHRINIHHFLRVFINSREGLMRFLQRYIENTKVPENVPGVVDTLLELVLYEADRLAKVEQTTEKESTLSTDKDSLASQREQLLKFASRLLQDEHLPYDENKALLVCHQRRFYEGCIYLWKKQKLYDHLLYHYMNLNASDQVLQVCQQFGNANPNLWLLALRYFSTRPDKSDELQQVVAEVDQHNLAPPLVVLKILSDADSNQSCSIGAIRDYLLRHLESGTNRINAMRKEVRQLREETMRNREVVRNLSSQVKIFQQQKCVLCHQSLVPPSVHFLCDHAYHKTCFDNYAYGDRQCPECAPRNKKLLSEAAAIAASNAPVSASPAGQIVAQLRHALQLSHSTETEANASGSSQTTSPLLTKALAHVLSQGGLDSSSGTASMPRTQSPLSFNAAPTSSATQQRDTSSLKSEKLATHAHELSAMQRAQSGSLLTDVKLASTQSPTSVSSSVLGRDTIRTGSAGYLSGDSDPAARTAAGRLPSAGPRNPQSLNPFGDSDSDEEDVRRDARSGGAAGRGRSTQSVASPDEGLGGSSSATSSQKPVIRTPFD